MIENNPFVFTKEEDEEFSRLFWQGYPRWRFTNGWKRSDRLPGYRGFTFLHVWWSEGGSIGINMFNFAVEFNPHHRDGAQ